MKEDDEKASKAASQNESAAKKKEEDASPASKKEDDTEQGPPKVDDQQPPAEKKDSVNVSVEKIKEALKSEKKLELENIIFPDVEYFKDGENWENYELDDLYFLNTRVVIDEKEIIIVHIKIYSDATLKLMNDKKEVLLED